MYRGVQNCVSYEVLCKGLNNLLQAAGTGTVSNDFLELLLFGTPRYGSHRNTCRYERNKTTGKIGDLVLRLLLFGTPWSESHRNRNYSYKMTGKIADQVLRLLSPQLTLRNKYIYSMKVVNLVEDMYQNMLV